MEEKCPITLKTFATPVRLPCGHVYEEFALQEWLRMSETCPLCKSTKIDYVVDYALAKKLWKGSGPVRIHRTEDKVYKHKCLICNYEQSVTEDGQEIECDNCLAVQEVILMCKCFCGLQVRLRDKKKCTHTKK